MQKIPILIIDDDEVDRYVLKRHLKESCFDLVFYEKNNGKEALDFICNCDKNIKKNSDEFPPVLIFLDVNMPLLNGFDFLDQFSTLKSTLNMDNCVVILFTSSARPEDRSRALEYSCVKEYLVKGQFETQILEEKIRKVLAIQ